MRLFIQQQVFTLGEEFTVRDEHNNVMFYVSGSVFEIPKNFIISDHKHQQVAVIENRVFSFLPKYDIKLINEVVTVQRDISFFYTQISIINRNWTLEGDLFAHEYRVVQGNHPIMRLSKEWFTWGDSYVLDIEYEKDAVLCLAIVIIVDHLLAQQQA